MSKVVAGLFVIAVLGLPGHARAYLDMPMTQMTIPRLMIEARNVAIYTVEQFAADKGVIVFRRTAPLQGQPAEQCRHFILMDNKVPVELAGVKAGQTAVIFGDDPYGRSVAFLGGTFYLLLWDRNAKCSRIAGVAHENYYDLRCMFVGTAGELAEACSRLLLGQEVVVRCRRESGKPQTQLVRYNLRQPHQKTVVASQPVTSMPDLATGAGVPATKPSNPDESIRDPKPAVRILAAWALAERGAASTAVLVATFQKDADPLARRACAAALARIGPGAIDAVPALVAAFRGGGYGETEDLVGTEAASAVRQIDPRGAAWLPILRSGLKEQNADLRMKAVRIAALLGPAGKPALPQLIEAIADKAPGVRYESASALAEVEAEPATVVPALIRATLHDEDNCVRYGAQCSLGKIGDPAVEALGRSLVEEKEVVARRRAAAILEWFGSPTAALSAIKQATEDSDPEVRAVAARTLKRIQPPP